MPELTLNQELLARVVWSAGWCGNAGCTDESCLCGLCRKPVGVADSDPRWLDHDEYCDGCALCQDEVPLCLMNPVGDYGAPFCSACANKLLGGN